ncbi:hypothetical protein BIW11_08915, partial [Tropilaelaps mercedesae]
SDRGKTGGGDGAARRGHQSGGDINARDVVAVKLRVPNVRMKPLLISIAVLALGTHFVSSDGSTPASSIVSPPESSSNATEEVADGSTLEESAGNSTGNGTEGRTLLLGLLKKKLAGGGYGHGYGAGGGGLSINVGISSGVYGGGGQVSKRATVGMVEDPDMAEVGQAVLAEVGQAVLEEVGEAVLEEVGEAVLEEVGEAVPEEVGEAVPEEVGEAAMEVVMAMEAAMVEAIIQEATNPKNILKEVMVATAHINTPVDSNTRRPTAPKKPTGHGRPTAVCQVHRTHKVQGIMPTGAVTVKTDGSREAMREGMEVVAAEVDGQEMMATPAIMSIKVYIAVGVVVVVDIHAVVAVDVVVAVDIVMEAVT